MAYKFDDVVRPSRTSRKYASKKDPKVLLGSSGLYIPSLIFEELGSPEYVVLKLDRHNKAIKVEPSPQGFKTKAIRRPNGDVDFYVGYSKKRSSFSGFEYGLYRPLGNGIFEFDTKLTGGNIGGHKKSTLSESE